MYNAGMKKLIIRTLTLLTVFDFAKSKYVIFRYKIFQKKWKYQRKILGIKQIIFHRTLLNSWEYTSRADLQKLLELFKVYDTNHELIRLGSSGDGGYLIPNDLIGIVANICLGVASDSNFESDLSGLNIKSIMADGSILSPAIDNVDFEFYPVFIGPKISTNYMALEDFISEKSPTDGDLMLSMDIEGDENFVIIETTRKTLSRFRIITIEFHNLDLLCFKYYYKQFYAVIRKILDDFEMVHIHPNTYGPTINYMKIDIPPVLEITFLRKDRITFKNAIKSLPHKLDEKNAAWMPEINLMKEWYL